jgi:hypothetical protein
MQRQIAELHVHRGRLLERIALQRAVLADQCYPVHAALDRTDRVFGSIQATVYYLRTHPLGSAALAFAALYIVKPARAWRWSARAFSAWQTWRALRERFGTP